jgi:hypothetical protein
MGKTSRVGDLELQQDLEHERHSHVVRIVFSIIGTLVLAAAVAGLFGRGPLSNASKSDPSGKLMVQYDRFERAQAPAEIKIELKNPSQELVPVAFNREFVDAIEIKRIDPDPEQIESAPGKLIYYFRPAGGADSIRVLMRFEFQKAGSLSTAISADNSPELHFKQFVYP